MPIRRRFERSKLRPLSEGKVEFIRSQALEDQDLMIQLAKMSQCLHQLIDVTEQIRNDHHKTSAVQL